MSASPDRWSRITEIAIYMDSQALSYNTLVGHIVCGTTYIILLILQHTGSRIYW
jgi:hypothetical protein